MSDLRLPDLNKVFLAGRLTRDPELRYLNSGSAVCTMGLAVSRRYRTKDGEQREDTMFINVETWNKSAEYCGENLKKGRPVLVEGSLKSDEWEDKTTGQKRTAIKVNAVRVNILDWDDRGGGGGGGSPAAAPSPRPIEEPVPEDDIPF
jgi:single-strand DNA-binding protein